jgi:hypothetical protein
MIIVTLNKMKKTKGTYYRLYFQNTPHGDYRVSIGYMKPRQAEQYRDVCEQIAQEDILGRMSTKTKAIAEEFFAKDPEFRQRLVDKGFIQVDESKKTVYELFLAQRKYNTDECKPRTVRTQVTNQGHFMQFENMRQLKTYRGLLSSWNRHKIYQYLMNMASLSLMMMGCRWLRVVSHLPVLPSQTFLVMFVLLLTMPLRRVG